MILRVPIDLPTVLVPDDDIENAKTLFDLGKLGLLGLINLH